MASSEETAVSEQRQCYICLDTSGDSVGTGWVSPCRCSGTVRWVHVRCLMIWVRQQEHRSPTTPPHCSQCHTRYVLSPSKGPFIKALDFLYGSVVPVCKFAATTCMASVALDLACTVMGVFAISQAYGVDQTVTLLREYKDSEEAFLNAQLIAYSLIAVSYIPWEDWLLKALRRSSRLPLLCAVLPEDFPDRTLEVRRRRPLRRVLTDALTLPVVANLIGQLFFASTPSPVRRVMVGGAVYLTIRCGLYMYLSQQLLRRRGQVRVLPVEEESYEAEVEAEDEDNGRQEEELIAIEEGEELAADESGRVENEEVDGEEDELNVVQEENKDVEVVYSPVGKEFALDEDSSHGEAIPEDTAVSGHNAMDKHSKEVSSTARKGDDGADDDDEDEIKNKELRKNE